MWNFYLGSQPWTSSQNCKQCMSTIIMGSWRLQKSNKDDPHRNVTWADIQPLLQWLETAQNMVSNKKKLFISMTKFKPLKDSKSPINFMGGTYMELSSISNKYMRIRGLPLPTVTSMMKGPQWGLATHSPSMMPQQLPIYTYLLHDCQ